METETGNSPENNLELVSGKDPVSVCSLNFSQITNQSGPEFPIHRLKPLGLTKPGNRSSFSKAVLNWRNALAIAAILTIGIVHFAYQLSVIKTERRQITQSSVTIGQVTQQPVEMQPTEFGAKKAGVVLPARTASPVPPRPLEIAPRKPQFKKKDAGAARAARLRRAEKILTGI